jgi:hypothetical protein
MVDGATGAPFLGFLSVDATVANTTLRRDCLRRHGRPPEG